MRVAHVLRKLDPAEWGGTETAIERLCEGLREQAVESVLYCPRLAAPTQDDPLVRSGYAVQRFNAFVPVLGISSERRRQMVAVGGNLVSFDLVSSLWRENDVSVIHAHALGRIGGIACTVARQRHLPFVVTIHGGVLDLPQRLKEDFNRSLKQGWDWGKLFGLLFQSHRLFRDADAILTCNSKEAALLRERHPSKRILVQPHGVPVAAYEQDHREAARAAFPQIRNRTVLLNVGRIDPVKNQSWLLEQAPEIFKKFPDAILIFAGACTDGPYGQNLEERINELELQERVLLTGGFASTDPRLIGLMQEARALVLSSISETFGLVLLEAWAAGTVVLASRTSGAKALVKEGENGWLFDLENPPEFHRALQKAVEDLNRSKEMAACGRKLVREEYSVSALAGRLKSLYEEIMHEKRCIT